MIAALAGIFWVEWTSENAWYEGLALAVLCVGLAVVGFLEIARMADKTGLGALPTSGIIGSVAIGTFPYWWSLIDSGAGQLQWSPMVATRLMLLLMGMVVVLVFVEQMVRYRTAGAIGRIACTFLALAYISVGTALIISLRLTHGMDLLLLFLVAVKFTDMGAYFTGKAFGKHKMIPWLSPGKSWEGLAGGLAIAAGASALAVRIMGIKEIATWEALVFGAVVGAAGQLADLCESLLKRSADVKDSGALVPNFGGVLDMVDSPLLSIPVATALLWVFL